MVRRAQAFQDLLAIPGGDGPYLFTRMFRESDRRQRRRSRRHFRLLKKVDGTIREIVEPHETVLFLTGARGFSFWERWVLGWRRAVVLTDRRAIFLQLDAARRPRLLHRQVPYGAITRIEKAWWGRVVLYTRSGDTLGMCGLRGADRAVVMERLGMGAKVTPGADTASGIESLCPYCHEGITGRPGSCPRCLRRFRRGWLAALFSLLIPGLGNYSLDYRSFAVLELFVAVAIWMAYLFGSEIWGMTGVGTALGPGWVFGAVHGADAGLTWYIARDGIFPAGWD